MAASVAVLTAQDRVGAAADGSRRPTGAATAGYAGANTTPVDRSPVRTGPATDTGRPVKRARVFITAAESAADAEC